MSILARNRELPEDIQAENYRMYVVVNYMSYLGISAHVLFIPLFIWLDVWPLVLFNMISIIAWVTGQRLNRQGQHYTAVLIICIEVILHAFLAVYFLGWDSGFHYYLVPMIMFIFFNHKQNAPTIIVEAILIFVFYIALYIYTHSVSYHVEIRTDVLMVLNFISIATNFTALGILGYYFRVASMTAEKKMEKLASTDQMTRLYNRRKMREVMETEKIRFSRSSAPFLLVLTDIDHFKKVNDSYGHDCGDYVLQQISKLMKKVLREQDTVCRWGGEEFLLMLPDTDYEGGMQAVEKLREAIASTQFSFAGNTFSVTMTFGVARFEENDHLDGCIKRADEALYRGKRAGRNQVVSAEA
jgi:diguanylate cyclase (GGDEF)-like protein